MHKKMLSLLLLVGAVGLLSGGTARAQDSTTDFVYDVGFSDSTAATAGAKALHDDTTAGSTVESIGVANNVTNLGSGSSPAFFTAATEDVSIGSSTGSTLGDWTLATVGAPIGALIVTNVTSSVASNAWVNLNVGGLDASMAAFNGTSKNFALSIGTVKSDLADGTNKALVVTSGGTARWVGITNLTAQSATVVGSSTTDAAWSALDGNVLDIGTFTAVYDSSAAALTATAAADAAALLRVGAMTYASTTSGDTLTLTATGDAGGKATTALN